MGEEGIDVLGPCLAGLTSLTSLDLSTVHMRSTRAQLQLAVWHMPMLE